MTSDLETTTYRLPDGRTFIVPEPYYLASCDGCGWVGSSGECGTDRGFDDSDVYCPKCGKSGADCGTAAESAATLKGADNAAK